MTIAMMIPNADITQDADAGADGGNIDPLRMVEHFPEVSVAVSSLIPAFYLRQGGTDAAHVRLLADTAASVRLPAILVQKSTSRIIDGMHRVEVAKLRGEWSIRARLVDCTDSEALVLAVKSNTQHGLPLSRADRISSAKRILANHPDWSDRALAGITGLSAKAIASLRNSVSASTPPHLKRLGRDGKRRPVVAGEGRRRAAEYINAHPEASLRQVARETDVSLGTVHDVRERIRRGAFDQVSVPAVRDTESRAEQASVKLIQPPSQPQRSAAGTVQRLAWPAISAKLTSDPALRYTDGGRAFLRWMAMHSMQADEWREFIDAIPQRWMKDVSRIAASMSQEWGEFAQQLRYRQEAAS
jgi:ParB-like chromosome segregation protein Spo0J